MESDQTADKILVIHENMSIEYLHITIFSLEESQTKVSMASNQTTKK